MRAMRAHVTAGLLLLLTCTLLGAPPTPKASTSTSASASTSAGRASQLLRRVEELSRGGAETTARTARETAEAPRSRRGSAAAATVTAAMTATPHGQLRDLRRLKTERRDRPDAVGSTQDHRRKDKYLKHITGPLYFSPKCRKHVYHVYHQTRDCTIPAYFKRCARLLTRLAGSPMCTGG
ncbi:aLK and LTK ligand 2a isoform X2 [Festucalex cinctus]